MSGRLTADEHLRPLALICTKCEGEATAYPKGTFCPRCSPAWFGAFAAWSLDQQRIERGLEPLGEGGG